MKPYKGVVKISCEKKGTCPRKIRGDVKPDCLHCPDALIEIVSLDNKILASARLKINQAKPTKR